MMQKYLLGLIFFCTFAPKSSKRWGQVPWGGYPRHIWL